MLEVGFSLDIALSPKRTSEVKKLKMNIIGCLIINLQSVNEFLFRIWRFYFLRGLKVPNGGCLKKGNIFTYNFWEQNWIEIVLECFKKFNIHQATN